MKATDKLFLKYLVGGILIGVVVDVLNYELFNWELGADTVFACALAGMYGAVKKSFELGKLEQSKS